MVYKQRPFLGCHIALYGFNDSEATHIKEIAELNGMLLHVHVHLYSPATIYWYIYIQYTVHDVHVVSNDP